MHFVYMRDNKPPTILFVAGQRDTRDNFVYIWSIAPTSDCYRKPSGWLRRSTRVAPSAFHFTSLVVIIIACWPTIDRNHSSYLHPDPQPRRVPVALRRALSSSWVTLRVIWVVIRLRANVTKHSMVAAAATISAAETVSRSRIKIRVCRASDSLLGFANQRQLFGQLVI